MQILPINCLKADVFIKRMQAIVLIGVFSSIVLSQAITNTEVRFLKAEVLELLPEDDNQVLQIVQAIQTIKTIPLLTSTMI